MSDEKDDGVVVIEALRPYYGRGVTLRKEGDQCEVTVEQAKQILTSHPVNPPVKIVSGLGAAERKEIDAYCGSYLKKFKERRNEGKHHTTPATP